MSPYMNWQVKGERGGAGMKTNTFGVLGTRPHAANKVGQTWRERSSDLMQAKVPRSSSPVTLYVELPCGIEQAFPTIAWDDIEDCTSRREGDSLGSQVNESDGDEQDFGDFALDFMADSPATLESSLCPSELVPFQGCVIPPLSPRQVLSPAEDNLLPVSPADVTGQDGALWMGVSGTECSVEADNKRRQDENEEADFHLRQLACRAKLLASVLEKLTAVRETAMPKALSPFKRRRLDQGCETLDSVEEMLRDVSTRCNAVLLQASASGDPNAVPMFGSFSGLQTSVGRESGARTDESEEGISSFRTRVGEHGTMRTQVFPHGRAFTSSTQQGGYRFRWVPNYS